MNEIIKKALNRGAPINTPIIIDIYEFIEEFNAEKLLEDYKNSIKEIISKISNIIGIYAGNFVLPKYATITLDENNFKVLRFSGENYFFSIAELLDGITSPEEVVDLYYDKDKFRILKAKIINIKNLKELKNKFPQIYELYIEQLQVNKNFIELEELLKDRNISMDLKLKNLSRITNGFKELYSDFDLKREQQFAKNFTLTSYLERLMQVIENMLIYAEEIISIYYNHTLDINDFNKEDEEKLNLYIAAKFMEKIECADINDKQRYLFYLTNYFKENVEMQVTRVKMKLDGKKVTPINLYQRYKKLLVANPNLLAVNFSPNDFKNMTKNEIEEFITAYLIELSANWELIPHDDTTIEKSVRTIAKRKIRNISEEERKQREEKLVNLYIQKKTFFDGTDPYFRIKGKQTFDGYVGYIYSNALVVLEKFYDNVEKSKIAENEAIYIISMKDFYELSKLPKPYLYASPLCKRVYHRGLWQERVLEYINRKDSIINPYEDTNKLILERKISIKE